MAPKLLAERRSGQYLADLHVGNPGTMLTSLIPARALDPISPALILPDAIDSNKWWQGKLDFADTEKHTLVFSTNVMTHVAANPQAVKKGEIRSYLDLLNPKWQGKIGMYDPTILGPGSGTFTFWYLHPALGKDFLRKFFTQQKVTLSRDNRQLLEWLVKGDYFIAVSPSELHATELIAKGLPIGLLHADQFKEGGLLNAGFGAVALINRAPHPNATKVYVNWLLSRDGQLDFSKATGYPSRRLDVPRDQFDPGSLPREGVPYLLGYGQQYSQAQVEASEFAKSLLKK
jgi:iron(III) transport system substrate-binding protein